MEREEEKPKAFTVKDRRRFSAEGDLKPEFSGNEDATPAAAPEPPPATSASAAPGSEAAAQADAHAHAAHHAEDLGHVHHPGDQPHDHHAHGGATPEMTFGTFLVGLSTQALMLLGDIPDPQTGKPELDLVGAQQLIDIVGMLERKTRGNLDREEAQLIEAILYELRMKYVERAKGRG
ncbi:MAG: DUF1844 domain-containing protein [Candidatus Binataceae bacterium]|jgi:hypothetical protein